ncbi:class I SAM-dependent methyltransferase [Brevibacillus brevis]|uniref:class I SAM-dependent methyltransferase n=1 Tax=Brevibacillus brevis TaxID=1393 RepID=UPI000D0EBCBC|nr:class I SAM-dependent methyltransferase [Brevibacillus brevis]PSJ68143.1 SAM-dependent methyltransferase [Brevibacillus brevis]RED35629.1 methyltransferase family protein [Brevibacillus brevis]GEC87696.1 methyltransferase [Brevibacillus brevis]VEF89260.1 tellurite resistance protein TehB [Brevibacillus brevis]
MANIWNERFHSEEYYYGEEPNVFIQQQAFRLEQGQKVIAFAEGEGRNAVFLAKRNLEVTAIDYAESGLQKTKKLAQKHSVDVITRKIDLLEEDVPSEEYDVAIMVYGHFHKNAQTMVLNKMIKAIKPKGIMMLEVFSKEQLKYGTGGPHELEMLYDPKEILAWCKGHEVIHFFYGEQERVAGKAHTGLAHVIQLVLRK